MPVNKELYYHLYESGEASTPPVVLIHGAGGNHLFWPSQVRRLPGFRVYAIDLPGHGKSGGRGQQTITAYAEHILEWLNGVGLHKAVFVGHSMGGGIAMELALDHPQHVSGLGLVGTAARLKVNAIILSNAASPTTFHQAIEVISSYSFGPEAPARLVELATQRMLETRHSVFYGDLLAFDAFDITDRLDQIGQPALVLCGSEDRMTPLRFSQLLTSRLPSAHLEIFPKAGHNLMLEQPEAVAKALSGFLSRISYQPG